MTLPRLTDDPSKNAYGSMLRKARQQTLGPEAERRIAAAILAPTAVVAKPTTSTMPAIVVKAVIGLGALALVSTFALSRRSTQLEPVTTLRETPAASANVAPSFEAPAGASVSVSVHDLPQVAVATSAPAVTARPNATPAPIDDLAAEAALLRATREDIANGRSSEALRKLDRYDARFGAKGAMLEEASVERVEALQLAGRRAEARTLASRLLSDRPDGAFARKLRSLLTKLESNASDDGDSK